MLKKAILFLLSAAAMCGVFSVTVPAQQQPPSLSAAGSVVMDSRTGRVLYQHNAHIQYPMASTTKIMTVLLTLESGDLDRTIVTTKEMVTVEGSSMGLRQGDAVSVRDLCYGMLLASGNDAANTAAIVVAGSVAEFAALMNQKAAEIGMKNTHFVTPSGLDASEHYSTAYDMALLGSYAMKNSQFASIAGLKSAAAYYGNPPYRRTIFGHNKFLSMFEGACGIKTGFTKKSGRCLVTSVERDGALLVAATLSAPDDWNDHIKMHNYGFSLMQSRTMDSDMTGVFLPVTGGVQPELAVSCDSVSLLLAADEPKVTRRLELPAFVYAPVMAGKKVGEAVYYVNGKEVGRAELRAAHTVEPGEQEQGLDSKKFWQLFLRLITA